jgi:small neutral amino acid transporter SnatA (MarC family)
MKTTISIITIIILFLFISQTTIQWKPFKISLENTRITIGFLLIISGLVFIYSAGRVEGYKKGIDNAIDMLEKYRIEIKNQSENEKNN